jgi:NADH-quinone oxidoreductase subunit N
MSSAIVHMLSAEILLVAIAVAIFLLGAFFDARNLWSGLALGGLIMAAALWDSLRLPGAPTGPILMDPLAHFTGWFALAMGIGFVALTWRRSSAHFSPEYTGSLLLTLVGLMITGLAHELVLLFLGLELISIPTYVVLYLGHRDAANQEATAKYFYLSILSSALLLYGFSFLYGTAGSTDLEVIRARLAVPGATVAGFGSLAKLAMLLVFAGLGFKIAAVPFQFYAPDVYQGTSNANAALLSIVPKAAGLVALIRIVVLAMPNLEPYAWRVALLLSVLTMTFGNVMGLWQDNLRRLFAYSSIAHTGYMLLGLAVALSGASAVGWNGVGAMLFYLCVYAVATLGVFAAFAYLGRAGRQLDGIDELAGLGRAHPLIAAAIAVCLFSLTGIPPVAGFWGKLTIFGAALTVHPVAAGAAHLQLWFIIAAIIGVLNSAVAAAYYLRIVAVMYFRNPLGTLRLEGGPGPYLVALASALLVIVIGVQSRPLMEGAMNSVPATVPHLSLSADVDHNRLMENTSKEIR